MEEIYTLLSTADGKLENILCTQGDSIIPILGINGKKRELQNLQTLRMYEKKYTSILPIFIGFGAGFAIEQYSKEQKTFVVIDLENLYGLTKHVHTIHTEHAILLTNNTLEPNIHCLNTLIHNLQYPLCIPIIHPFVKEHLFERYKPYIQRCKALAQYNPFGKTRYRTFRKEKPSILCLWQPSFIAQELVSALQEEEINYTEVLFSSHESANTIIQQIIESIYRQQPDFILTINHTGFDTSNIIAEIIHLFQIPIASWFMDNPELDIERQRILIDDNLTVFTYDKENLSYLHSIGIAHAYYLPLATNISSFTPTPIPAHYTSWRTPLGFLGDSRTSNIRKYQHHNYTTMLHLYSKEIAETFRLSPVYTVQELIKQEYPFLYDEFMHLPLPERRDYIQLILDIATRRKRIHTLNTASIMPITILGDTMWNTLLTHNENMYIGKEIAYSEARYLYSQVEMIVNSTCTQMKHAVNQRVFDCPIAGALVLTERTPQLENLFDIGIEVVCYSTYEELLEKIRYYHTNTQERMDIVHKAQRRINMEHTWRHRIQTIIDTMKTIYG